jgi:hypothetical protein
MGAGELLYDVSRIMVSEMSLSEWLLCVLSSASEPPAQAGK